MPNIAAVLKAEIVRLARKELRDQTEGLKKSLAAHRSEISALRRRVQELEKALKQGRRNATTRGTASSAGSSDEAQAGDVSGFRFRAKGMASNRKRLGLSAADFGLLVGASGPSVYSWEQGKAKPRPRNLAAIASLRGVGKREIGVRLAALKRGT